jgi:restriction endonuclease S subunit
MPLLSSIADIRMGATLRGRDATRPDPKGSYCFLRIGDISQDGSLRTNDFLRIEPNEPVKEELWLRAGDVLFPNRGTRTTALAFPLDQPKVIVGPQFFIVRPDDERVSAEYLAWFLRSAEAAAHFEARRKGTYVQIIQRGDLAELEIPLPPLPAQRKLVGVAKLALAERDLSERLLVLRWRYSNEQLLRAAKRSRKIPNNES